MCDETNVWFFLSLAQIHRSFGAVYLSLEKHPQSISECIEDDCGAFCFQQGDEL